MRSFAPSRHLLSAVLVAIMAMSAVVTAAPAGAAVTQATAAPPSRHVVRPHDTIRSVAARYHLAWRDLARWNQLRAPYTLHSEGVLRLTPPDVPLAPFTTSVVMPARADTHWREGCPVPFEELRLVWVTYIDFTGQAHQGYVVVDVSIAAKMQRIFKKLYDARYRIQAMAPMAVNSPDNPSERFATLAYNCRLLPDGATYSQHAYGTAIDVNPVQNPYVTSSGGLLTGEDPLYKNRTAYRLGIIHPGGTVQRTFAAEGLLWGGAWQHSKDYMHFSVNGG